MAGGNAGVAYRNVLNLDYVLHDLDQRQTMRLPLDLCEVHNSRCLFCMEWMLSLSPELPAYDPHQTTAYTDYVDLPVQDHIRLCHCSMTHGLHAGGDGRP